MSLLKVRTWSVIALLVMLQAPSIVGKGGTPPGKTHVDQQIEQVSQGSGGTTVHVIVTPDGDLKTLFKALKDHGIAVRKQNRSGTLTFDIAAHDLSWLEGLEGIASVSIDAPVASAPLSMAEASFSLTDLTSKASAVGELRQLLGLSSTDPNGAGIGVAVIDSGIAPVLDLAGRISAFYDFTNGANAISTTPNDRYGHGTHVAGLIAGSGLSSLGRYQGVAPGARLIGLKVLGDNGSGRTSDVISAV